MTTQTLSQRSAELWFERYDVEASRGYEPIVTAPRLGDTSLSRVADVADRATVRSLSSVLIAASAPMIARGLRDPRGVAASWEYYKSDSLLEDPARFFREPPSIEPERRRAKRVTFRPREGEVFDLTFDSQYAPHNLAVRAQYLKMSGNRHAHARLWRHHGPPRPTAICVHGYLASQHLVNTELFNIRWLYRRGMNVMLFLLPFHGERRHGPGAMIFPDFDMAKLAEGLGHAVYDVRILLNWLRRHGAPSIGLMGASLGAYFASLMAGIDDRLDFIVPMIPATSLIDTVMDWRPADAILGLFLQRLGWELNDLRRHAVVHTPLSHAPRLPPERVFIIAGDADRVTKPYQAHMLRQHFDRPETHWFAGSHIVHLNRGPYLRALGRFLGGIGAFEPREEIDVEAGFETGAG